MQKKKKSFYCKIAGIVYKIEYLYEETKKYFNDYILEFPGAEEQENAIVISYTQSDIDATKELFEASSKEYREYGCIFDKIVSMLPQMGMILMHGAAIEYHEKGYIFTAPSGTGKTTHIRLWKKYLGDEVAIVNGDKPEISFDEENVWMHGAPWCGKEGWQINKSVPLAGVCLLRRAEKNRIKEISAGEYLEFFMKQFYFDMKGDEFLTVLDLFDRMTKKVPFYLLECNISEEAARCSFEKMTGEQWKI